MASLGLSKQDKIQLRFMRLVLCVLWNRLHGSFNESLENEYNSLIKNINDILERD